MRGDEAAGRETGYQLSVISPDRDAGFSGCSNLSAGREANGLLPGPD
jgi:hypothetical protein